MKRILSRVFEGWTLFEKIWLITFTLIGFGVSIAWGDSWIGFVATITGMVANILVAKGKIANYFFGFIAVVTYGFVAYGYALYGEAMLNWGFYAIANVVGFFIWHKNKKRKTNRVMGEDIPVKSLTKKGWLLVIGSFIMGSLVYAIILIELEAQQVRLDSMAVVLSIIGQILMTFRFKEQWHIWIAVNVLSVALWIVTLVQSGGNDYVMVVMWISYLVNSIYGFINWKKLEKLEKQKG